MSVTFRLAGTTYTEMVRVDEDFGDMWVEFIPDEPYVEMNLANSNAGELCALLEPGKAFDWCGEWTVAQIPAIYARCLKLLNSAPEKFVSESYQEGNFVFLGRDMDYVTRRLTEMLALLKLAQEKQDSVVFS